MISLVGDLAALERQDRQVGAVAKGANLHAPKITRLARVPRRGQGSGGRRWGGPTPPAEEDRWPPTPGLPHSAPRERAASPGRNQSNPVTRSHPRPAVDRQ